MTDGEQRKKRNVIVEKKIGSITKEDIRVAVVGTVLSVDKEALIFSVEDPSGELTCLAPNEEMIGKLKVGSPARVIGIVIPDEEGAELRAEIVQDFSGIDKELFQILHKVLE